MAGREARHLTGPDVVPHRNVRQVILDRPTIKRCLGHQLVAKTTNGDEQFLAAIDEGVPTHVLSAALYDRFESRGESEFANRLLSAMRKEFGGHDERPAGG